MTLGGFLDRIFVLSYGGLVSAIYIKDSEADILIDWPKEYSINVMKLVAHVLREQEQKNLNILLRDKWLAYVSDPDKSSFIVLARVKNKGLKLLALSLIKQLAEFIKDLPEESTIVGEKVVEFLQRRVGMVFKKIRKLTAELNDR
ncbi:MAG: hypothetical protein NDP23_02340 [Crenarchaeota archaeon]|nr:hypothetical protein [Thermoproteota archaeon]MCR8473040.1 hypothetical protein [Thermoproteota archaeon]MCR8488369.1 hypothetical protein [Thermoproteota archaeon]